MLVRSAACRVGWLLNHTAACSASLIYGPSTRSEREATCQCRHVQMTPSDHAGASRIGWHIFDRTSATKSSAPRPDDKSDNSDASKGARWRIVESRDLRTINKADGKIDDKKAATFLPEHVAPSWPPMFVASHTSSEEQFSRPAAGINARIVLGSFRASAEMYLSEWKDVVQDTFGDHMDVEMVELAVCDVAILKMWPFKGLMVNASRGKENKAMVKMPVRQVHYFGDVATVTEGLAMNNRLTGYVFVVDSDGRIRWRTTGKLTEPESHSMMQAVRKLAPDHNQDVDS